MCDHRKTEVIDTETRGIHIRRRRQCKQCSEKFTTYEISKEEYAQYNSLLRLGGLIGDKVKL